MSGFEPEGGGFAAAEGPPWPSASNAEQLRLYIVLRHITGSKIAMHSLQCPAVDMPTMSET